jgi:hypothetical protein
MPAVAAMATMAMSTAVSAANFDECRRRCGFFGRGHVAHSGLSAAGLSAKQCHECHGREDDLLLHLLYSSSMLRFCFSARASRLGCHREWPKHERAAAVALFREAQAVGISGLVAEES